MTLNTARGTQQGNEGEQKTARMKVEEAGVFLADGLCANIGRLMERHARYRDRIEDYCELALLQHGKAAAGG